VTKPCLHPFWRMMMAAVVVVPAATLFVRYVVLDSDDTFRSLLDVTLAAWIGRRLAVIVIGALCFVLPWWLRDTTVTYYNCGHDLSGNVSGRCPECGKIVECERRMRHDG
jgi:hypothetical protein